VKVSAREKKFIKIGLLIIAVLALYYALTIEQPDGESITDTVELKTKMLEKQRETINLEGVYESRLQLYNARLQENKARFLPGDTANVAGADLLNRITDLAEKSGVEITQKSNSRPEEVGDMVIRISAQITTSCDMEQFVQLLTEIANYEKFLTIDDISISVRNRGRARNPINTNTGITPRLTVSGYIIANETRADESSRDANL